MSDLVAVTLEDRRVRTDRREFGWRTVFYGFLRSRRRAPRRSADGDVTFLDWHHPWLFFLSVGTMLMSATGQTEICQMVDPLVTARFVVPKWVLKSYQVPIYE